MGTDAPTNGSRPFTEAHAIMWVDFGFGFSPALDRAGIGTLRRKLYSLLSEQGFVSTRRRGRSGEVSATFERRSQDQELLEVFHIHDDHVHVVFHEYRGWDQTKAQALELLLPAQELTRAIKVNTTKLQLAFRDGFFNDEPESYLASEVFKENSYIPQRALGDNPFWASTFVENLDNEAKSDDPLSAWSNLFSRVVADARVKKQMDGEFQHVTLLTHSQVLFAGASGKSKFKWNADSISHSFDLMHDNNANVVREILSDYMLERIGLMEIIT